MRGEDACGYEQGIAWQEKSDEEAGLNEDDNANQKGSAPVDQSLDVVELLDEVLKRFEHGAGGSISDGPRRLAHNCQPTR
jgi:hypothetical protein